MGEVQQLSWGKFLAINRELLQTARGEGLANI